MQQSSSSFTIPQISKIQLVDYHANQHIIHEQLVSQKAMSHEQFLKYIKSFPDLNYQLFNLEKYWLYQRIPKFYIDNFFSKLKIYNRSDILKLIIEEFQSSRKKQSSYHTIFQMIKYRQICLQNIENTIELIQNQFILKLFKNKKHHQDSHPPIKVSVESAIEIIKDLFNHFNLLREKTINLLGTIHSWKIEIQNSLIQCQKYQPIFFFWKNQNYYDKIKQDTKFIWNSILCQYIEFTELNDIMLIRNVLNLSLRQQKELLEQYFIKIVYPKNDTIFNDAIEAIEYLSYEKILKSAEEIEQQKLIQNYLAIQAKNQKDEKEKVIKQQQQKQQLNIKQIIRKKNEKPKLVFKLRSNYNQLNKFNNKMNQINTKIKKQLQAFIVKPKNNLIAKNQKIQNLFKYKIPQIVQENRQPSRNLSRFNSTSKIKKIYQSRIKFSKQTLSNFHINKKKRKSSFQEKYHSYDGLEKQFKQKQISSSYIFKPNKNRSADFKFQLNDQQQNNRPIKQFNIKKILSKVKQSKKPQISSSRIIKTQRKISISKLKKQPRFKINTMKQNQFVDYAEIEFHSTKKHLKSIQIPVNQDIMLTVPITIDNISQINKQEESKQKFEFFYLKEKAIPIEVLSVYVQYLFTIRNPILKFFTNYNQKQLFNILNQSSKVLIFEVINRQQMKIGQIIAIQIISKNNLIRYSIQFIHLQTFQFLVKSIFLFSERVFKTTFAQDIVCKFKLDRNDQISEQFIKIIDDEFSTRGKILEKPNMKLGDKIYDRLYVIKRQFAMKLQSIKFSPEIKFTVIARALLFTSNYKYRKSIMYKYPKTSKQIKLNIGLLYSHILSKIMTYHHIKMFKQANGCIKQILKQLYQIQKLERKDQIKINQFNSLKQFKVYLQNTEYEKQCVDLTGMEQSRFLIKKQIISAEFNTQIQLDFNVKQTVCNINQIPYFYFCLQNNHQIPISIIRIPHSQNKVYLIPSTSQYFLLLSQAEEFLQCDLDLHSYLNNYFKNQSSRRQQIIQTIFIPESAMKHGITQSTIFNEQFPQRQFYYTANLNLSNKHFFRNGIIRQPKGLIFKYPLILGFYLNGVSICYLLRQNNMIQELY